MEVDLAGRLRKIRLNPWECLLPLYEAVINSMQAIEDTGKSRQGTIKISIIRDKKQSTVPFEKSERRIPPICGFIIEDNGVGFNDENMEAFKKSDTTHKISRGGKGVGRFQWIKAFEKVEVKSIYQNGVSLKPRKFTFSLKGVEENNNPEMEVSDTLKTTIELINLKDEYREKCPGGGEVIADSLVKHCISYFLEDRCPNITVYDDELDHPIDLKTRFKEMDYEKRETKSFQINDHTFKLTSLFFRTSTKSHSIYWLGNGREVESKKIEKIIPGFPKRAFEGEDGVQFFYKGFLSSPYLDENINQERTGFTIPRDNLNDSFLPTVSEIEQKAVCLVESRLVKHLAPFYKEKKERILKFIRTKAPGYSFLIKKLDIHLSKFVGLNEESIETTLHRIAHEEEKYLKKTLKSYFSKSGSANLDNAEEKKEYEANLKEASEIGGSKLAEYVFHRKFVLEVLEKRLSLKLKDHKKGYEYEEAIHSLIFPIRTTSDDIGYKDHNLWIIDERLAYQAYIASDKNFDKIKPVEIEGVDRPESYGNFWCMRNEEAAHPLL